MKAIDAQTLPELAATAAATRSGSAGFLVPQGGRFRAVGYAEWWDRIVCLASELHRAGIRPGERVLLMMETRYEWILCDLAIMSIGAITVPIYPTLPAAQLAHPLEDVRPKAAIVSRRRLLEKLLEAKTADRPLDPIYLLERDRTEEPDPVVRSLHRFVHSAEPPETSAEVLEGLRRAIRAQDPATILYTSGTSSHGKGVILTHEQILSNARMMLQSLTLGPSDRTLSVLPLAHIMERTVSYTMIAAGASIAYARGIDSLARDAAQTCPTMLIGVPRLFESTLEAMRAAARAKGRLASGLFRLAERSAFRRGRRGPVLTGTSDRPVHSPKGIDRLWEHLFYRPLREKLGGRLRVVVSGSAPLGEHEAFFFCGAGLPLLEGYGMTETGPVISVNRLDRWKAGTVGPPLDGVEVRIAEDEEILVRSPSVMNGYLNLESETRETIQGGWLHTGDLGRLDEEGFLTITGRKKDMIVTSGGKNISPLRIEDLLRESPLIDEAIVFGDRRPYLVALLVANVEALDPQGRGTAVLRRDPVAREPFRKEVAAVNQRLAAHERIRNFELLEEPPSIDAGTLTPTLKVRRSVLEAQYAETIASLYDRPRR